MTSLPVNIPEAYVDTYKRLRKHKPPALREVMRDRALDLISAGHRILHSREKLLAKPRVQFLYIHHVFRDEEKPLANLLKKLSERHVFISYSEAVQRTLTGDIDKPYISFSSDDGLLNNVRAGAILKDFDAKACFFICPGIIGQKDFGRVRDFASERLHFPPVEFMGWEDVQLLQQQGHEIGGHTWSHVNIARTAGQDLEKEISDCFQTVKEKCGAPVHFAYPYGRHSDFSAEGRRLVFSSGYASCASAVRGCHIPTGKTFRKEDLLIRRDHIVLDWPLEHIMYFIARNAAAASGDNNNDFNFVCE